MKVVALILCCVFAGVLAQDPSPCDGITDDLVPDPESCSCFYSCSCNGAFRMPCPPGLEFNAKLKVCDWPYRANCSGGGGEVVTPTPSPGGPIAPCTNNDPSTIEYPNDCQKYYYCYKGYPYVVQCDAGEYYSEPNHACIKASSCPSTGGGSGGGSDFKCQDKYGTYAYPGDETKYYYCYNSVAYVVQCYSDQKYDPTINACQVVS